MPVFKIIGGHGQIAQLIAKELSQNSQNKVFSLIRNPEQADAISALGAVPQIFDVEHASVQDFVGALNGADFIIWSAGAGGKGRPNRVYEVDRDAAIRSMQAARELPGVSRYVMVSFLGSSRASELIDEKHFLYHYAMAKSEADEFLTQKSGLKYTIVNPGHLSNDEPTGQVDLGKELEQYIFERKISRGNVAKIVSTLLTDNMVFSRTLEKTIECLDGSQPILEGLRSLE